MSHRYGKVVVIEPTAPEPCSECGEIKELRPYGEGGAQICFKCSMRNDATKRRTDQMMAHVLFGEDLPS